MDALDDLWMWDGATRWARWTHAIFIVLVGGALGGALGRGLARLVARRGSAQGAMVARRLVGWTTLALAVVTALRHLGLDLSVVLGAAGVLTVALGFAAQTSASNLISGLFLMGERPFVVGDFIEVDAVQGEVISVDLLSVKLRTLTNLLVRIPNETMVKARVTNYTRHPIRRLDLDFRVAFSTDLEALQRCLLAVAEAHSEVFDEPAPQVQLLAFGESGVEGRLCVWVQRQRFIPLRTEVIVRVHQALAAAGVRFALPARVLHQAPEPP